MVRYTSLEIVFDGQLKEILVGELRIARYLSRLGESVSSSELKSQLRKASEEYQERAERLERVVASRGAACQDEHSRVIDAFIKQAGEISEHRGDDLLLDHALTSVLRHLETYQRSLYESAREVAIALNVEDVATGLDIDMEEHGRLERSLTILEEDMLDAIVARRESANKQKPAGQEAVR